MCRESALQLWRVVQDKPLCRNVYIHPRGFGQSIGTYAVCFRYYCFIITKSLSQVLFLFFFLLRTADVLCLVRPLEPFFKVLPRVDPGVSTRPLRDGWQCLSRLLSSGSTPPLIGLKTARLGFGRRGHRPRLCLNHFNASTLARPIGSLIKTGPRQDSHQAHRKDLACSMLCLTLALSLFFFVFLKSIDAAREDI